MCSVARYRDKGRGRNRRKVRPLRCTRRSQILTPWLASRPVWSNSSRERKQGSLPLAVSIQVERSNERSVGGALPRERPDVLPCAADSPVKLRPDSPARAEVEMARSSLSAGAWQVLVLARWPRRARPSAVPDLALLLLATIRVGAADSAKTQSASPVCDTVPDPLAS